MSLHSPKMSESNSAIHLDRISKVYPSGNNHQTLYRLLKSYWVKNGTRETKFALHHVDLRIGKGEKVGIIGNNGAGKTTLLKIIAGLCNPTDGSVQTNGDVVFLAGLGIGMLQDLTARENIFLYGTIYGMERDQIRREYRDILQWAELEDFAEAQLRTFSLGMRSRLAFSTARHMKGDIFLWDEALLAGDKNFNLKCQEHFQRVKEDGVTYVVASHNLNFIESFCTKTLWLDKGKQIAFDDTGEVLKKYRGTR
jgi:ABC-type polysaccharide/polyol phosphate transport system ATPase subunit